MKQHPSPKTWSGSRGNRLQESTYPEGHPVHVVIGSYKYKPVFRDPRVAAPLFALIADHSKTHACCLMPDHLHWLMADSASMEQLVHSFKSYSTYVARTLGCRSRVWQRSYWDHVVRRDEDLYEVAKYIVQNPVRKGMVTDFREYPYQVLKL